MATSVDYIEFICEQIKGVGFIRYRKMFGEYMVYVNEKPLLLVCDDTVYVKIHDSIVDLMQDADRGIPYKGAKEHFVLDIDNAAFCQNVIAILEPNIPLPKPKKAKTPKTPKK